MADHRRQTGLSSGKACHVGNAETTAGVFQVEGTAMCKDPELEEKVRSTVWAQCVCVHTCTHSERSSQDWNIMTLKGREGDPSYRIL